MSNILPYHMSLLFEFRVVMAATSSRMLSNLYLLLFVGGLKSSLRYLCLFVCAYSGVQHIRYMRSMAGAL